MRVTIIHFMNKTITILITIVCLFNYGCGTNKNGFHLTTDKNELTVEVKKEVSKETTFQEKAYNFGKDYGALLLTVFGLFLGGRILKRKLLENHISTALIDIQNSNKEISKKSIVIIDDINAQLILDRDETLKKETDEVIKEQLLKVNELSIISQNGSRECQSLIFYLKETLQNTLNLMINSKEVIVMSNQDVFSLVRNTLTSVMHFATQVVPVPRSGKTTSLDTISRDLHKYVNDPKTNKYKYFNQGVNYDPYSALFMRFYVLNFNNNSIIKRSIFQMFENLPPVLNMMNKSKIYAPPVIFWKNPETESKFYLFLIGYKPDQKTYFNDGRIEVYTDLIYTNYQDNLLVIDHLVTKNTLVHFSDVFIPKSEFKFDANVKFLRDGFETIKIKANTEYLHQSFKGNKRKIRRKLVPKKDGGIRNYFKKIWNKFRQKIKSTNNQ